jgi:2-C-methyl-D-erythritol 4-phosphate cytidylyltransferase/2-C-methyl-D-erythritol 2,4-cyclodiphosphate synthase
VAGDHPRDGLGRAQTPQGFQYAAILAAHRELEGAALTDDTALATAIGVAVATVAGEERNLKVTTSDDLADARLRLAAGRRWRTGFGTDVHRLVQGRPLVLGGVAIPHSLGLEGHSDADVALHAITDALLGTIAAGDIGHHFPPTDPRWKDADSAILVRHACELVKTAGGRVEHVDLTLLCERPKISPWREAIRARIGSLLGIGTAQVSVKATTTEKLGFTGREEGILAQAIVTVALDS